MLDEIGEMALASLRSWSVPLASMMAIFIESGKRHGAGAQKETARCGAAGTSCSIENFSESVAASPGDGERKMLDAVDTNRWL